MLGENIKLILGISHGDELIEVFISNAIYSIKNYLNNDNVSDEIVLEKYPNVIMELAIRAYMSRELGATGLKSITQGQRSVTFDSLSSPMAITDDLKAMLPTPYVRLF